MTRTAVILIVISAFLHAGWNLAGKRGHPTIAFFLSATIIGVLCLLPFPILFFSVLKFFSPRVWLLLVCTGLCQAVYYAGLGGAYQRGDMSVAYPMARSMPVILVALTSIALGRGESLSGIALGGILLIVFGAFTLPMRGFKDLRWSNYFNYSNLFALVAALGTVGYSLVDDGALRLLRNAAGNPSDSWRITIVYAFFEGTASSLWLGAYVLVRWIRDRNRRFDFLQNLPTKALTGVGIYLTYSLVLISMAFVRDVSYVVAFRQLSLPIGVLLGVLFLKEGAHVPKFVGVAIMFAGLVLVGIA